MPLWGQSRFCLLPWEVGDQGEGQSSMRIRMSCDMGRTSILLGEAASSSIFFRLVARKVPESSSPNFIPSSVPNAKRGEPPQGWHGFRLLLRGYWAARAGTRAVRAWQKGPSWWAEGCQRWRLDWEFNSSTRGEWGEGLGLP